jgi:putative ATPase
LTLVQIAADLLLDRDSGDGADLDEALLDQILSGTLRRFDKRGDIFYDQISALHKSVRGSNPDAALYWLSRMLDGGCDPEYIARRVARMASEDVGNADPRALRLALDAWEVLHRLGSPEGELALAQAVCFLAAAPKSNAVYKAFDRARRDAHRGGSLEVPSHLRNAPSGLAKSLGHGRGYRYAHDEPHGYAAGAVYMPVGMEERRYYEPVDRGLEARIRQRLAWLRELDAQADSGGDRHEGGGEQPTRKNIRN